MLWPYIELKSTALSYIPCSDKTLIKVIVFWTMSFNSDRVHVFVITCGLVPYVCVCALGFCRKSSFHTFSLVTQNHFLLDLMACWHKSTALMRLFTKELACERRSQWDCSKEVALYRISSICLIIHTFPPPFLCSYPFIWMLTTSARCLPSALSAASHLNIYPLLSEPPAAPT